MNTLASWSVVYRLACIHTWIGVIGADRAEEVFLLLIVVLAQQLSVLQYKLIPFPQLSVTYTATEAVEVVHALERPHHELCGGDFLQAPAAFGRK